MEKKEDLISRKVAIDALGNAGLINYAATGSSNGLIHAMNVIKGLPAAQPRRLRGRWVETERRGVLAGAKYYKCDICAQAIVVVDSTPMAYGYNYCPRCGAQMEGQE